jgi:hypothetical protein
VIVVRWVKSADFSAPAPATQDRRARLKIPAQLPPAPTPSVKSPAQPPPAPTPSVEIPAQPPPALADRAPKAPRTGAMESRLRLLLPVLARTVESLSPSNRERFRTAFQPYLSAAERLRDDGAAVLTELERVHNVNRFLPLLDAAAEPAELTRALGIERIPMPDGLLRSTDLADYDVVSTSGAGDRFRVVREAAPGYRVPQSRKVIRKSRVELRAE